MLVEIKAPGLCHTAEFTLSGAGPEGIFPAILGRQGAGTVVEAGAGVTSLKKGDHVIPLYTPECRQCEYCLTRKTNLCVAIRATLGRGVMPGGRVIVFGLGGIGLNVRQGARVAGTVGMAGCLLLYSNGIAMPQNGCFAASGTFQPNDRRGRPGIFGHKASSRRRGEFRNGDGSHDAHVLQLRGKHAAGTVFQSKPFIVPAGLKHLFDV